MSSAGSYGGGSSMAGVMTITGDTGGPVSGAVTLTGLTLGSGIVFNGTSATALQTTIDYIAMSDATSDGAKGYIGVVGSGTLMAPWGGIGSGNVFICQGAGNSTVTGSQNVGIGQGALAQIIDAANNIAIGNQAAQGCLSYTDNVAIGYQALASNGFGGQTGISGNVCAGSNALRNVTVGAFNVALGYNAGVDYTTNESSNILISNEGIVGESNVIRIGTDGTGDGQQEACYIAGIYNESVGVTNAAVFIDSTGKLGTNGGSGGGVISITGDVGGAATGAVTLTGGSSGAIFTESGGNTLTQSFEFLALPQTDNPLTMGYISMDGDTILAKYGGVSNMFLGVQVGNVAQGGTNNFAFGFQTLSTAALSANCIAIGAGALTNADNVSGDIAIGTGSLQANVDSSNNIALGVTALGALTTGSGANTAIGHAALGTLDAGDHNIALGFQAGSSLTTTDSSNIIIGNTGTVGDNNTIRIGTDGSGSGQQDTCYIAGIYGVTGVTATQMVTIDSDGLMGSAAISAGGVTTIAGDAGSTASGAVTITGGSSGAIFTESGGNTLTETFNFLNMTDTNAGATTGYVALGGTKFIAAYGGVANRNVFIGNGAGIANVGGTDIIGIGSSALNSLSSSAFTGSGNIGIGTNALTAATTSAGNVGVGQGAIAAVTTGNGNNAAFGHLALQNITTGEHNISIGSESASALTSTESSNIIIGSAGVISDDNTIRIGTQGTGAGQQNLCFIAGISGATVANSTAVLIDTTNGQLGTVASSIRYKENIYDMGADSYDIMKLRPVTFNYKADTTKQKQYGLIAEEVQQVIPRLVSYNSDGLPETVRYHELPAMLLNEIQRLQERIKSLEEQFAARVR